MLYKTFINDLYTDLKNVKTKSTIKSDYFKKKIKIFKKRNTMYINPNLKYIFKNCSVKDWIILSNKIQKILKQDDFQIKSSQIISSLILSYISPNFHYLLSSYYHCSHKRLPKIKRKFNDLQFLIKTLILNNDIDPEHIQFTKNKLHRMGISNFKFTFEDNLTYINNINTENNLSLTTKDILKHYLRNNKRKKFKIFKVRKDFIYDAFFLFFLDLSKYELTQILFYKKNLNYYDYDYEIFVIKRKQH